MMGNQGDDENGPPDGSFLPNGRRDGHHELNTAI
jgi:hypothetical protein